jgi:hypothetical protein
LKAKTITIVQFASLEEAIAFDASPAKKSLNMFSARLQAQPRGKSHNVSLNRALAEAT